MARDYSSLHQSITTAVQQYESYKSQYNDVVSDITVIPSHNHNRHKSTSAARLDTSKSAWSSTQATESANTDFVPFSRTAGSYEDATYLIDLDFLVTTLHFLREEHPHSINSLQKAIKGRASEKRSLWQAYTREMQTLARAYTSGKPMPMNVNEKPEVKAMIKERRAQVAEVAAKLDSSERTCVESIFSALSLLHAQANKDIKERYAMPDPINDKVTSVRKHNERVKTYNQLIPFVTDDLRQLEKSFMSKKRPGVVEAMDSLRVEDYPPYK